MLLLLEINFYPLIILRALVLVGVGWPPPLPRTHPFHRGEGGWLAMTWPWPWQGGWGGDPEPGTYIYIIWLRYNILKYCIYLRPNMYKYTRGTPGISAQQKIHLVGGNICPRRSWSSSDWDHERSNITSPRQEALSKCLWTFMFIIPHDTCPIT